MAVDIKTRTRLAHGLVFIHMQSVYAEVRVC